MSVSIISKSTKSSSLSTAESKAASVLAMALGSAMIFMIGFSHIDVVHNAAHDTRHSSAFPCH